MNWIIEALIQKTLERAENTQAIFENRQTAGFKLASLLKQHHYPDPALLAIPYGGIPVALPVEQVLGIKLQLAIVVKIPLSSSDDRFGLGAIDASGKSYLNPNLLDLPGIKGQILQGKRTARDELRKRLASLECKPANLDLQSKTALIVDDGAASGLTSLAASMMAKNLGADRVIVAVPVCSSTAAQLLDQHGVEIQALHYPEAPAIVIDKFYKDFPQLDRFTILDQLRLSV